MITKQKKVYYCEHCKRKKGLSAASMARHEKRCTSNLDRECGFCKGEAGNIRVIAESVGVFTPKIKDEEWGFTLCDGEKEKLQAHFDKAAGGLSISCPACMLALLKAVIADGYRGAVNFKYSETKDTWWEEQGDAEDNYY